MKNKTRKLSFFSLMYDVFFLKPITLFMVGILGLSSIFDEEDPDPYEVR